MAEEKKDEKKTKRPTALKRDIQSAKRHKSNRSFKARVATSVRAFKDEPKTLNEIYSILDKGVKKGILKKNKVDRLKSKFSKRAKEKA